MSNHMDVNEVDTSNEEIDRDMSELLSRHDVEMELSGPGESPESSESEQSPAMDIRPLLAMPLKLTFSVACPNWTITDDEIEMLANAYGDVIDHYFPDMNVGPAGGAILATAIVIASHANTPRKLPDPVEDNEA
jgi:hypothetical protein